MLTLWSKSGGGILVQKGGGVIACDECPCEDEGVNVCDYVFPESFDVSIIDAVNNSCTGCGILTNRINLTYQGRRTDMLYSPGGPDKTECHYWKSADDCYGSPGTCGGIFDNKVIQVLIPTGDEPQASNVNECEVYASLHPNGTSPFADTLFSSINALFTGFQYANPPDEDDFFTINFNSWFNTGHCNPDSGPAKMKFFIPKEFQ